ncbi:hypothetical protein CC80DRAFT_502902 [Byssothecium circinans]|uniref:Myb-like domain-containing protein n=1 Tax=Byssothecium circinans TaxID=147558 RepID=A0A6A5U286_9PLEO|nr:hypothetical protein CC80DRAFT_502902 [Byssothecium circinans]
MADQAMSQDIFLYPSYNLSALRHGTTPMQSTSWNGQGMRHRGQLDNGPSMQPATDSAGFAFDSNTRMNYPMMAAQPGVMKGSGDFHINSWLFQNRATLPRQASHVKLPPSLSPKSQHSNVSEQETAVDGEHDHSSASSEWAQLTPRSPEDTKFFPGSVETPDQSSYPYLPSSSMMNDRHNGLRLDALANTHATQGSRMPLTGLTGPPLGLVNWAFFNNMSGSANGPSYHDSNHNLVPSPRMPTYENSFSANPFYQQRAAGFGSQYLNAPQANSSHRTLTSTNETRPNNTPQPNNTPPTPTPSPRGTDAQSRRREEDRKLVKWKLEGLTYKDIREKLGSNAAESTLRGRYRALTKRKEERVRKPMWTEKDIRLLQEDVEQQLDSFADIYPTLSRTARLSKMSWKRTSAYIVEHGGSYAFGNATCKKKWADLQRQKLEREQAQGQAHS